MSGDGSKALVQVMANPEEMERRRREHQDGAEERRKVHLVELKQRRIRLMAKLRGREKLFLSAVTAARVEFR